MTDPSQYFKGRTVQEQMNEVIGYVDVRSAEVATDAIAADVAQVHQDMLDADADAAAAAASAAAAAGTLANAVKKTGEASQSIEGDVLLTTGDLGVAGDLGVTGNLGVTGSATVPTPVNNTDAATKKYVDDADALDVKITAINTYAVGLTGNQTAGGIKTLTNGISAYDNDWHDTFVSTDSLNDIKLFAKLKNQGGGKFIALELTQSSNTAICYGILGIHNITTPVSGAIGWFLRKGFGSNNPLQVDSILIAYDGNDIYLASRKRVVYGNLRVRVKYANDYFTTEINPTPQIEWLTAAVNIGDGTGYTLVEAVE